VEKEAMHRTVSNTFVSKAIYGLIAVLAVLLVMEDHPPVAWQGAVTLFGTTLAVALVDTYSETVAATLAQRRRLTRAELCHIWHDVSPVLVGAQAPTLVLLLSAVGLFPVAQAITIAQVACMVLLFGYGIRVGQLLHEQWFQQLVSGLIVFAVGGLLVAIKALFH
jgi:hypothetical protein